MRDQSLAQGQSLRYPILPLVAWVPRRVEQCACGGLITADPENHRDVEFAVRAHQEQMGHRAWSNGQGFDEQAYGGRSE